MKIKTHITILAAAIITIPLLCSAFILFELFYHSSDQYLYRNSQNIDKNLEKVFSKKDIDILQSNLRLLSPEVEFCAISPSTEIIFTSIPELKNRATLPEPDLYAFIDSTTTSYFYQYTMINISYGDVLLVTRINRLKNNPFKTRNLVYEIIIFLFAIVFVSVIILIIISKTIFKSIDTIDSITQEIASGNVDIQIASNSKNNKKNEITSILDSIEKMRVGLLDHHKRKNMFVMGISHDLRTPVATIKGYSEAIKDGVITSEEDIHNAAILIQNKSAQLEEMIDTLINYMKLNNSEMSMNLKPGSITTLIKNFAKDSELTGTVFKRKIISRIELPEEDIIIPLDEQLALRSFENLFRNALRYTNENDQIDIISYIKDSNIYLEIKDTGIGIEEKDLMFIFDMFYRGTNSRKENGLGIGLSVVKNIANIHGWKISVASEKDKGTCFTITIPFNKETKTEN